jgi:repressor LexA
MSINKLSGISNISLGYLSDLENNKFQNPTLDKLKAIAEALIVSVDDFFKSEPFIPQTEEEVLNGLSEEDRLLYKKIKASL